ncbi:MAG: putative glycoside hydrolase [Elusimicrobia bacterium]|nr:putative glycoside hydrolase [Candidatus Liberimonas magnetica]
MKNYACIIIFIYLSFIGFLFLINTVSFAQDLSVNISTRAKPVNITNEPLTSINNSTSESIKENPVIMPKKPKYVRGIHLTAWLAGSVKGREKIFKLLEETELNTVVIDIKEMQGEVYIPGVKSFSKESTFTFAIPNIEDYLAELHKRGIYTIARIVVFKDNLLPRKMPELGVKNKITGDLWQDRAGVTWLDPFNKEAWNYNIDIAKRAKELGFDEVQFDYIRFPSDGNTKNCSYSKQHTSTAAVSALDGFLRSAYKQLKPLGLNISIDVFGLTTTNIHDMGIGQKIVEMSENVDFVSPMVYPSHYNKGEYGIPDPDIEPYDTVYLSLRGAKRRLGNSYAKLRPYLQDFSIKHRYGAKEVVEQIQAVYDNDIGEWLLWNPSCRYTIEALKGKEFSDKFEKSGRTEPKFRYAASETNQVKVSSYTLTNSTPTASYIITNSTPAANYSVIDSTLQIKNFEVIETSPTAEPILK